MSKEILNFLDATRKNAKIPAGANPAGTLKTREWKTGDHEKYGGGKGGTGKGGTKFSVRKGGTTVYGTRNG